MQAVLSAVVVVEANPTVLCRNCGKPIARRDGPRLVYERKGSNPVYMEIESGSVLIQCHHALPDSRGRFVPCREINRLHA